MYSDRVLDVVEAFGFPLSAIQDERRATDADLGKADR
jgi:hypothetical protein